MEVVLVEYVLYHSENLVHVMHVGEFRNTEITRR
jgi:hypothetical protein